VWLARRGVRGHRDDFYRGSGKDALARFWGIDSDPEDTEEDDEAQVGKVGERSDPGDQDTQ